MPSADLLRQFGLARNPFVDRTAEKTLLDGQVCPADGQIRMPVLIWLSRIQMRSSIQY